jgi:hypothetical protein
MLMGRASFVIGSALVALTVGTMEFLAYVAYQGPNNFQFFWPSYRMVVLPAPVAAAISAYISILGRRIQQRSQWELTWQVCFLAYIVYVPLFGASLRLAPPYLLDGWGGVVFVFYTPLIIAMSIIPALGLEYVFVGMAQSRREGA